MSKIVRAISIFFVLAAAGVLHAAPPGRLAMLPGELEERNHPASWTVRDSGTLTMSAGAKTNWFISPLNGKTWDNAPMLLFVPAKDFVLIAKVSLEFRSRWDAGALVLYLNETTWAKFAFEAPQVGQPSVVSVVTRGESDDCTAMPVTGNSVYLKIAKIGPAFIFYVSNDGQSWKMTRAFRMGNTDGLRVGFSAQSPTGNGSTVTFSGIQYLAKQVTKIDSGE